MPEYQVREYSNDRYDSEVRVKSAYRLYSAYIPKGNEQPHLVLYFVYNY